MSAFPLHDTLPWALEHTQEGIRVMCGRSPVCRMEAGYHGMCGWNAELIVTAVNAHADLLAFSQLALLALRGEVEFDRAALVRAGGDAIAKVNGGAK